MRRRALAIVALAAAMALAAGPVPASAQADASGLGQTVLSVEVTAEGPIDVPEVADLITIVPGRPLTLMETGETIKNLFATRLFRDVQVRSTPVSGGVVVTIDLFRAYRVSPLKFDGKLGLSRQELRRAVPFTDGSVFLAGELERGAEAIRRRLSEEGYPAPLVDPEVAYDAETARVAVTYHIDRGAAAAIAPPLFDGDTAPFSREQLLKVARLDPGNRYRETKARRDAQRMTRFLREQDHLGGLVELIAAQPTGDGRVTPVYRISVGPKFLFDAVGIEPKKLRKELIEFLGDQEFGEDLILQYTEEKTEALQRKGHYRASVSYTLERLPEQTKIGIVVEEGEKFAVESVAFRGNDSIPVKELRPAVVTEKKGLPFLRPGRLTDTVLEEDRQALAGLYRSRGWIGAKVGDPEVATGSDPDRLTVVFPIEEGPRTMVSSVTVDGAVAFSEEQRAIEGGVESGQPFSIGRMRAETSAIGAWYRNRGWNSVSVEDSFHLTEDSSEAEVSFDVVEGQRTYFGRTVIRGNWLTDTDRIERLVSWKEGEPFSVTRLAETQRRLSQTGVFSRVSLLPDPANPETGKSRIIVDLLETRPMTLTYGIGYQYASAGDNRNDPSLLAGITYNNLFGSLRSTSLDLLWAPISGRGRVALGFRDPFLFGEVPLVLVMYAARQPVQGIDLDQAGVSIDVSKVWEPYLRVAMRYDYQYSEPRNPEDVSDAALEEIPRYDQPIRQSAIGPNVFYDRRDDIVDPTRGWYASGSYSYAFPFLSADARYQKVAGQGAIFRRLGARSILALAVRGGAIYQYGPRTAEGRFEFPVPINERFFAGGPTTNRGFSTDLQGIPGQTVDYNTQVLPTDDGGPGTCADAADFIAENPDLANYDCNFGPRIIGGNGFLGFNAELRIRIAGDLGTTLFWDATQVWSQPHDMSLSFEGESGLRQSVGVGLFYMTPIGPVRVEYGQPIDPRTIDFQITENVDGVIVVRGTDSTKESGKVLFSIGYPF
ncbi:MAG TPA: POTRA domain-containing protein [Thermoanaerobaculia bacterium]